ncbi:MAG: hypothetical protein ACLQUZ_09090 [Rhizomicrobium sp.]
MGGLDPPMVRVCDSVDFETALKGKCVRTMLPKSYITRLYIGLVVQVRFVGEEIECPALLRDLRKRHVVVQGFDDDAYTLAQRNPAPLNFAGKLRHFDIFKNITYKRILCGEALTGNHCQLAMPALRRLG